ncbi:MAG: DUF1998 domain-containing protein [Bacteroidota bacterium]
MNYKQFENIQTRKAISAYGGIGSILETRDGAILVNDFNEWPYFRALNGVFNEEHIIEDKRFKNRLKKYFKKLEYLIRIPANDLDDGRFSNVPSALLSGRYFPEWFYCTKCRKFDRLDNWNEHWKNNVQANHKELFYPPKCYKCYVKAQENNTRQKFYELEQIRFILTSPSGDIADIPWDRWAFVKTQEANEAENENTNEEPKEEKRFFLSSFVPPTDVEYEFQTSDKFSDLNGIWIIPKRDGKKIGFNTLSGLFNLRVPKNEIIPNSTSNDLFKPVIRSSNSVYYPNILSSIYLPAKDELDEKLVNIIKQLFENGQNIKAISSTIKITNGVEIGDNIIQKLIDNSFVISDTEISKTELEYRFDEYRFLISKERENIEEKLIFEKIDSSLFAMKELKSIYRLDKIKVTTVQSSFTRQEPIDKDYFLVDDSDIENTKENIKKKYTSSGDWNISGLNTKYLPAVESFGEGIFFEFDAKEIEKWSTQHLEVSGRASKINNNNHDTDSSLNKNRKILTGHILLHTFSHLIIKELEFLCGYPATSIQERLYFDEGKMQGVMIYTIAGAEGSYGGLSSICKSDKIGKLIRSALFKASDCSSDPICYESTGQGVGNLNFAACYSCALLPETSCEEFNCFLDRRMLVDKKFGFMKQYIDE